MPVSFELEQVVRIRPVAGADALTFEIDGFSIGPVTGVRELWAQLLRLAKRAVEGMWAVRGSCRQRMRVGESKRGVGRERRAKGVVTIGSGCM